MKRSVAAIALLAVTACAPVPLLDAPIVSYRDGAAQIASQTDVTAARMVGEWTIRQRFDGMTSPATFVSINPLPDGALQMSVALGAGACGPDSCADPEFLMVLLEPSGPGRWTPVAPPHPLSAAPLWVHWMDFDSRTAAIGTPTGEFGWIMDKNATGGADRITAARDILDWFGYDIARLKEVRR